MNGQNSFRIGRKMGPQLDMKWHRARGCFLGQLAGDALGSLVEFQSPQAIRAQYPDGVRELADGGTWDTIAGQPTDDSELALVLARTLAENNCFDADAVRQAYVDWMNSGPFDIGNTTISGLSGRPNHSSQANGALMRISPLGIFGAGKDLRQVADWARQDAMISHPHPVCQAASALFAMAIADAIATGCTPAGLYGRTTDWSQQMDVPGQLRECILAAESAPPEDYLRQMGWVCIAVQNALWQLLHAESLEAGVVDTVMRGGDTDTNAAICGALLGAIHGESAIPVQWRDAILSCRPEQGRAGVHQPRPKRYWPCDALELTDALLNYRANWGLDCAQCAAGGAP